MMERVKSESSKLKRWKKIGGGSFLMGNRHIKTNQKFTAYEEEIPKTFRDAVVLLGEVEDAVEVKPKATEEVSAAEQSAETPKPTTPAKYFVKKRSAGYYNVVDQDGKIINEKALRIAAAEALVETLQ